MTIEKFVYERMEKAYPATLGLDENGEERWDIGEPQLIVRTGRATQHTGRSARR